MYNIILTLSVWRFLSSPSMNICVSDQMLATLQIICFCYVYRSSRPLNLPNTMAGMGWGFTRSPQCRRRNISTIHTDPRIRYCLTSLVNVGSNARFGRPMAIAHVWSDNIRLRVCKFEGTSHIMQWGASSSILDHVVLQPHQILMSFAGRGQRVNKLVNAAPGAGLLFSFASFQVISVVNSTAFI